MTGLSAVILAGGAGTRLRPLVSDVPKPMAEVDGHPFLEYVLRQLRRDGISNAIMCVGVMADKLSDHFGDGARWGVRLRYSVEAEPLGTAGALKRAEPLLDGDRWLLMNGDSLFDIPLDVFAAAHERRPATVTIALAHVADAHRYGGVTCTPDGLITAFDEKPDASAPDWINGGLYIIERTVLDRIPADRPVSFEREVLPDLVGSELRGVPFDAFFVDIGVPDDYLRAQRGLEALRRLVTPP